MEEENNDKIKIEDEDIIVFEGQEVNNEINNKKKNSKGKRVIIGLIVSVVLNIYLMYMLMNSLNFSGDGIAFSDIYKLNKIKSIMNTYYYKEIDKEKLVENFIDGMVKVMDDPYTIYYTKEEMEEYRKRRAGSYRGTGVSITIAEDGLITIVEVFDGSPAKKAGIEVGDKLLKADGKDLTDKKNIQEYFSNHTRESNVERELEILKSNKEVVKVLLKVEDIKGINVDSKIFNNNIGYIRLKMFDDEVSEEFKKHLDKLMGENIEALLIDIRENPGGDFDEVISIADLFLDKGDLIVYTEDKNKVQEKVYARSKGIDLPIGVLIDGGSASASEVLAGALRDNNKAWLLGEKTYGKGLVQLVVEFEDGSGLKMTTDEYFTPNGKSVQGEGLTPDYEVKLPDDFDFLKEQGKEETDTQLKEAIDILSKKIESLNT